MKREALLLPVVALLAVLVVVIVLVGPDIGGAPGGDSAPGPSAGPEVTGEFRDRFEASYRNALAWLAGRQWDDGAWGREVQGKQFPSMGLTSLASYVLAVAPKKLAERYRPNLTKGIEFILKHQDESAEHKGSFFEPPGQLRSYVTSIVIMVLAAVDKEKYAPQIADAVRYLRDIQSKEGFFAGGTGYGEEQFVLQEDGSFKKKVGDSPNMSTVDWAAAAMEAAGVPVDDEYWRRVAQFVSLLQNSSETNVDPEWIQALADRGYTIGNDGSVIYSPQVEQADRYGGADRNPDGTRTARGYGSMTYAAIKTYLYAGLKPDDPKVQAAVDWARKNYTLDVHPGFPYEKELPAAKRRDQQGMFYYYMMMARALEAYTSRTKEKWFVTADRVRHDWAAEIAAKIMERQREDGSWVNPNPRWWEDQDTLVTPYALMVYSILAERIL